jgi:hypothetical protein
MRDGLLHSVVGALYIIYFDNIAVTDVQSVPQGFECLSACLDCWVTYTGLIVSDMSVIGR